MQLPSTKVGLTLTLVVLIVAGTIVSTKIEKKQDSLVDLKNIDLTVERKTQEGFKAGDSDNDGLADWLEEFYKSDSNNPDTDNDGTPDGEEVSLDRDPTIAGPNDPLITRKDLINTEADLSNFVPGTITDKTSVDLFSQYLILKKQGLLQPEDEAKLVDDLSKSVTEQASLKDAYSLKDLNITISNNDTLAVYGDRVAQISISYLSEMDSYKNLKDSEYLLTVSKIYKKYANDVSQITVPSVAQEVHLELLNYLDRTSIFFETMTSADKDPLASLVIITQYRNIDVSDSQIYTTLSQYFKNNDIIFDTESTNAFWKNFEN